MVLHSLDEMRARLSATDCRIVAESADALAAAGEHLDAGELASARVCMRSARGIGTRMQLARNYLALLDRAEAPDAGARLIDEIANPEVRGEIFWALADLGPAALPTLGGLARHRDPVMRWHAIEAVRDIGGADVLPLLLEALEDDDFSVRWAAAHGLIDAGEAALVPLLRALVTRPGSVPFHRTARRVLRSLAPRDGDHAALIESLGRTTTIYESGLLARDLLERHRRAAARAG
jgi:HEAT repeat protein